MAKWLQAWWQRVHEHLHSVLTKATISEHLKVCDSCKENSNINLFNIIRKYNTEYETKICKALLIRKIILQFNRQVCTNGFLFLLNVFQHLFGLCYIASVSVYTFTCFYDLPL